jgi:hypothetical protein
MRTHFRSCSSAQSAAVKYLRAAELTETKTSLDMKVHVAADKVAAEALNKFVVFPENYLSGEIDRLALEGSGTVDAPRTWNGHCRCR